MHSFLTSVGKRGRKQEGGGEIDQSVFQFSFLFSFPSPCIWRGISFTVASFDYWALLNGLCQKYKYLDLRLHFSFLYFFLRMKLDIQFAGIVCVFWSVKHCFRLLSIPTFPLNIIAFEIYSILWYIYNLLFIYILNKNKIKHDKGM